MLAKDQLLCVSLHIPPYHLVTCLFIYSFPVIKHCSEDSLQAWGDVGKKSPPVRS